MGRPRLTGRLCRRCGQFGAFTGRTNTNCDACHKDPTSRVKNTSDQSVRWARARNAATRRLIETHSEEWETMFAEERARVGDDGWPGATLREVDDYERRRDEALAAGWS